MPTKVNSTPSSTSGLPNPGNTGAEFSSFTTMLNVSVALSGGMPLSVTLIVTGCVPGPSASPGIQVNKPLCVSIATPNGPAVRV